MKQFAASTLTYGEQTRLPLEQQACADPTDSRWCSAPSSGLRGPVFDDVAPTSPARRNGALSRDSGSQLAPRLRPTSPGEPRPLRSIGHTGEWAAGQRVSTFLARWGGISPFVHLRLVDSRGPAARSVLTDIRSAETGSTQAHRSPPILRSLPSFSRSTSSRR